eukprot:m.77101 g.77101  ORF g.77101 m.77101 type:complete len:152 (-) comp12499_c0_seq17:2315-2770(-)
MRLVWFLNEFGLGFCLVLDAICDFQSISANLQKRQDEVDEERAAAPSAGIGKLFGKDPVVAQRERIERLDAEIHGLRGQLEELDDKHAITDRHVEAETLRFFNQLTKDLRQLFTTHSAREAKRYQAAAGVWTAALEQLDQALVDAKATTPS